MRVRPERFHCERCGGGHCNCHGRGDCLISTAETPPPNSRIIDNQEIFGSWKAEGIMPSPAD